MTRTDIQRSLAFFVLEQPSGVSKLFEPLKVGTTVLQQGVELGPLTRYKASEEHYYTQRASTPGTLLITEGTLIAARAGGPEQIATSKVVAEKVHAEGSFVFMQLWALGRSASSEYLTTQNPSFPYVSASDVRLVRLTGRSESPRPLNVPEIKEYADLYAQAAKNAECNGVEIHGFANGYLPNQFLQDVSNKRTDASSGCIVNRARFVLEVVDAVVTAIGAEKTPSGRHAHVQRMLDPLPTFSYVIARLAARYPDLAYSNDALHALWAPRPFIRAGGFTREGAIKVAERGESELVAFGRLYISNPDLPERLEKHNPLTAYDPSTLFLVGEDSPRGYTDYAFAR
ncbi:hypothetical protein C8R44DRAFT_843123 [Mycena epipterygia]|nr:hypothetical protein C8R44DRAFT_843123 [Mycena epipterygia]